MHRRALEELLGRLERGETTIAAAVEALRDLPFTDLDFAKPDLHRALRTGHPEVIYGEGKTPEQIVAIGERLAAHGQNVVVTRVDPAAAARLQALAPEFAYHADARIAVREVEPVVATGKGTILVVSAGTSDQPVAEEAAWAAHLAGNTVERLYDVGVAGIHRLARQPRIGSCARERADRRRRHGRRAAERGRRAGRQAGDRGADERRLRRELRRSRGAARHAEHVRRRRHRGQHRQRLRRRRRRERDQSRSDGGRDLDDSQAHGSGGPTCSSTRSITRWRRRRRATRARRRMRQRRSPRGSSRRHAPRAAELTTGRTRRVLKVGSSHHVRRRQLHLAGAQAPVPSGSPHRARPARHPRAQRHAPRRDARPSSRARS